MEFLEQLLNVELGLPARFLIAFVFVLLLIALTAWIIRRIAGRSALVGGLRARQHRITVIDSAAVDTKRRLVLVRWDNTEHLLLVGGDTDIVVDSNGGRRGMASERAQEAAEPRTLPADELPRPIAARPPEPVQPRERQAPPRPPAPSARPAAPTYPRTETPPPTPTPVPERSPAAAVRNAEEERPRERSSPFAALRRMTGVGRSEEQAEAPSRPPQPEPRQEPRSAPPRPAGDLSAGPRQAQSRPVPPAAAPVPRPSSGEGQRPSASAGEPMEEMATRLEAALKRPMSSAPAPSGPREQVSSTSREMSGPAGQRSPEPQRPSAQPPAGTGSAGSPSAPARSGEQPRPASGERPASLAPRPSPAVETGRPDAGPRPSAPARPGPAGPENPFAGTRPAPATPQRPAPQEGRPSAPQAGERRPDQAAQPRPAGSPNAAAQPQRTRPPEIDLAAAMAAELNLPPQPRTGATPPAEQDRPRATSSETESEKEDKNEGDDLNIYDQIIKRDT